MTRYDEYCARQRARHGAKFDTSGLAPQFVAAFNAGDTFRVKIDAGYEKPIWGYVAATTGWRPSFMLMRHRGQRGSSDLLRAEDKILAQRWL